MRRRREGWLGSRLRTAALALVAQVLMIALFLAVGRACRGPGPAAGVGRTPVQIVGNPDYGSEGHEALFGDADPGASGADALDDGAEKEPPATLPLAFGVFVERGPLVESDALRTWIPPEAVRTAARTHVRDCTAYVWPHDGPFGMALYHRGALVYLKSNGRYHLTSETDRGDDSRTVPGPEPGRDIDGDGVPDLLIYFYTGGAHCCHDVLHFNCGERTVLRAKISGWHSQPVYADLDGDGRMEVRMEDMSFHGWNVCDRDSPRPTVILRVRAGRYTLAPDLMKRAGPPPDQVAADAWKLRHDLAVLHRYIDATTAGAQPPVDDPIWDRRRVPCWHVEGGAEIPVEVWSVMLDLIYGGRIEEAAAFLCEVWPEGRRGREEFMSDLAGRVHASWFGARLPWAGGLSAWLNPPDATPDATP